MSYESPYADAAFAYRELGWLSPIPLGAEGERGAKAPVPKGYTGRAAKVPTDEQVASWAANGHGVNNVGLHLAAEQHSVGIDVDAYGDKRGDEVLAELEAKLGPLPPTVRSTARAFDSGSGIRLFALPEGVTELKVTKIKGGIEIIQAKHRYVACWPSVHPETGERYEWYVEKTGRALGRPPKVSALPELPPAWVAYLSGGSSTLGFEAPGGAPAADLSTDEARLWLAEHGGGERPCRAVRGVLRKELAALEAAVAEGTSRYDTAVEGSWALIQLAAEGHLGVKAAVTEFGRAYRAAVRDEPNRDPSEWARMVTMGVGKAAAALAVKAETDEWAGEPHTEGQCPERDERSWPGPNAPLDVATRYVEGWWTVGAGPGAAGAERTVTLRRWRGQFYAWTGRYYEPISEEVLRGRLGALLKDAEYFGAGATPSVLAWKPTPQKINAVMGMLVAVPGVLIEDTEEPADGRDGRVSLTNGVLDLGTRALKDHDPARFNLTELPFAWSPEGARRRARPWLRFLESLWPDAKDADAAELLAEWFGYVLSGRTDLHKALVLIGPTRSGKSTIARVLTALVGERFTASPSLSAWGAQFGLAQFLGKTSATITDADASGRAAAGAVEDLKRIIGEDTVNVPRKYLTDWTGRLGVRLTFLANNVPAFLDTSGALAQRFVPIRFTESFIGREDTELGAKLCSPEVLSGVFEWALDGYDRVVERRAFVVPRSSRELWRAMHEGFSPVRAFLTDRCTVDPKSTELRVERGELYRAYKLWCGEQGRHAVAAESFGRDLRSVLPLCFGTGNAVRMGEKRVRVYFGIELNEDAEEL